MFPRQTLSQTAHDELEGGNIFPHPRARWRPRQRTHSTTITTSNSEGTYNAEGARVRVPSGLCISAWREYLADYNDPHLVDFLEFGWPVNFYRGAPLVSTATNHPSATRYPTHIEHYIAVEIDHGALARPFTTPPIPFLHISPLMTRDKRDSQWRRVILDLSWPQGAAVNDGVRGDWYLDGPATIRLPTVEYMEQRLLALGPGAYLYKTDLARGYRQLRVDPADWPLLGFAHAGHYYMDICQPFGLRTSSLFMQRTSEAISFIHKKAGFYSRPYLDDFGGAEDSYEGADAALSALQRIMADLGVEEAKHKVCRPSQEMIWLGLLYDTLNMTISILPAKLDEIMELLREWEGRTRASQHDLQCLVCTLQFVAAVSPPTKVFSNRILQCLREAPKRGTLPLSWGFRQDIAFFLALLPHFNGVKIMDKKDVVCQRELELDACLTGCGAWTGTQCYAKQFPSFVLDRRHTIAHLELLNIAVALKVWRNQWAGQRVRVWTDNANAAIAVQTGRSRDEFMAECVREIFFYSAAFDIELHVLHRPGVQLQRADALSREHTAASYRNWVRQDPILSKAERIEVHDDYFKMDNKM